MQQDDANSASTSPTGPRSKAGRATNPTAGAVRSRTSPPPPEQNGDGRPPTKRARKAINCEPCRNSKLKCDRNRPCSSCVLRGTSALCYQHSGGHDSDPLFRGDDHHHLNRIDPAQEIARLRHSINLLEAHIFPSQRVQPGAQSVRRADPSVIIPKKEAIDVDLLDKSTAPGMLASQGQGGLYAGPTSAATHLLMNEGRSSEEPSESRQQSVDRGDDLSVPEYDRDLLALLPSLDIIDGLIDYYFSYCNWIYRHVNQVAFTQNWTKYKSGASSDRLVLATACNIMAVAAHYLPSRHSLLENYSESYEELAFRFIDVSRMAFARKQAESRTYSLDLVELLLIRCHYLVLCKTDSEEIWSVKGELLSIGTAMGLHRDPGKFKMPRDVAERRRWAWWHIVLLERWQAFMFGRPLSIAAHHYDTQLPSYCDPALDSTGRLYLPNIALFQLAVILGDIMDDAVSVRSVPYESVQANDRALIQWMDTLPPELDLDEYRVARNLASTNPAIRRLGVQSVIIRTSYHHIRFTLHRPYASMAVAQPSSASPSPKGLSIDPAKTAQSLEIAVGAADKLITMVGQSRPDILASSSQAVPGHMNWGPFHCFSAAMFFSFQLIANPDQPGAGLFRANIAKAITSLEQSRGFALTDKCFDILQALAPLYSVEFPLDGAESRVKKRASVLSTVRKLAFPYHDSHYPRNLPESPSVRGTVNSPANSNSVSPPMGIMSALPMSQHQPLHYDPPPQLHNLPPTSSMRTPTQLSTSTPYPSNPQHALSESPHTHPHQSQVSTDMMAHPSIPGASSSYQSYHLAQPPQPPMYGDSSRYPYVHPMDDPGMWGASVGFGQGEWAQFLHVMQRPDVAGPSGRHPGT